MGLRVIDSACRFSDDLSKGVIVIESDLPSFPDAINELKEGYGARNLATHTAAVRAGISSARINGNVSGAYAVNKEGTPLDQVRDANNQPLDQRHERMQPAHYRVDVPISKPIM
jgi:hypothetical protein